MKRIYTLVFCILCCMPFLSAQVTMTRASHGFNPGDKHLTQGVEYKDPGTNGQGLVWDFKNLTLIGVPDTSVIATNEEGNGADLAIFRHSDEVFTYYNVNDYSTEYKGYKTGAFVVTFDKPLVKVQYPQMYGTSFEGSFGGTVKISDNFAANITGTYTTHVDASGTILLPGNISLPVIRVKTTERLPKSFCGCSKDETIEMVKYLWYAQDTRYPLFVSIINKTVAADNSIISTSQHSYLNANIEQKPQSKVLVIDRETIAYTVSPNPFKDNIQISYSLPQKMKVSIGLYDALGIKLANVISQTQEGEQTISFFAAPYAQREGIYFLKMQFGDQSYSEKIMKSNF